MSNFAVVLAGGVGSRFWPLSRDKYPKQFLRIIGRDTFFEATIRRVKKVVEAKNIYVVTNKNYHGQIMALIKKFGVPERNIILEPKPLNTLPAIAVCARLISLNDSRANIIVFPSDHYISGGKDFRVAVAKALALSEKGYICLMGVKPDDPSTGYGYIKTGLSIGQGTFRVKRMIEKPVLKEAKRLFGKKDIYWNCGIFCFQAKTILGKIKKHHPALFLELSGVKEKRDIIRIWPKIKPVSMDYGIIEKTGNMAMVKVKFNWQDIGSWGALDKVLSGNNKGKNITAGDKAFLNCSNVSIYSSQSKKLIACVGIKDAVVVDTPDVVLVCAKDRAQDVKQLVEIIKKKNGRYV